MIKGRFEMRYILFLTLPLLLCAKTTFITQEEYAAQLYKNPRGIGCQHCHGEKGEGKTVAKYLHKGEEKSFRGPVINNLNYASFYAALSKRIDSMPRYFLTPKEISALYFYLNEEELLKAKNAKKEQEEKEQKEKEEKEAKEKAQVKEKSELKKTPEAKTLEVKAPVPEVNEANKTQVKTDVKANKQTEEMPKIKETTEAIDVNALFKEATKDKK
jgi:hypothetical protein